jgi:hypothetical protein
MGQVPFAAHLILEIEAQEKFLAGSLPGKV